MQMTTVPLTVKQLMRAQRRLTEIKLVSATTKMYAESIQQHVDERDHISHGRTNWALVINGCHWLRSTG